MRYITPKRIIKSRSVKNFDVLLKDKSLQHSYRYDDCAVIKTGGYMILDFGEEWYGGVAITNQQVSNYPNSAHLRITFGESVSEAMSNIGEKNSGNYHSMRDVTLEMCTQSTLKFGATGFRFIRIESLDSEIYIKSIKAYADIREIPRLGSFECSDKLLNNIWNTGARTVQLNMHEYIWDGIKRDQGVFIGDMHPEISTISAVFGNDISIRNSLDFVRDDTPDGAWMNEIATYSIWWIIIHYDIFMRYGDVAYLKEQYQYLKTICDQAIEWVNNGYDTGGVKKIRTFVDWSSKDTISEIEGVKSLFAIGLQKASSLFYMLNDDEYGNRCQKCSDSIRAEKCKIEVNKRIAALNILSGRNSNYDTELLSGNSAAEMSCFMGYYVLLAKARMGDYSDAIDIIKSYWGGMLSKGATTFWEDFDIEWMDNSAGIDEIVSTGKRDIHGDFGRYCYEGFRHSLCHGWASGPTAFLSKELSGIKILSPGFKKVRINPNLAGLDWIDVSYPTAYGNIDVRAEKCDDRVVTKISAPPEIEIV